MAAPRRNVEPPTKTPSPGRFGRTTYGDERRGFGYALWKAVDDHWVQVRDTGPRYSKWDEAKRQADQGWERLRSGKS